MTDRDEPPLPGDDEAPYPDDEPPYPDGAGGPAARVAQAPASSSAARATRAAPTPTVTHRAPANAGIERYGEAVVRQVLGATFVREEPYEPPTRFS